MSAVSVFSIPLALKTRICVQVDVLLSLFVSPCTGVFYGACAWMCFRVVVFSLVCFFIHMHFITRSQKK